MKDLIRVVLIDPDPQSRETLKRLLGGTSRFWLAESLAGYQDAARQVKDLGAQAVLLVLDHDPAKALELLAALVQADPELVVVPASRTGDGGIILKSIRAGAREFVTLPVEPADLLDAFARLVKSRGGDDSSSSRGSRIVTVAGASGGIGCTTLAVNLASTLALYKDHETLLFDLDLAFGSVDACLDVASDYTLANLLQNFDRLDLTLLKRSMTRHESGLYVLPRPADFHEAAAVDPESLKRLLALLRASYGSMVVDAGKGLQATDFVAYEMSDVILIVVQLDLVCLRNTARLIQLLRQYEGMGERLKLIENRAGLHGAEISRKSAEETLKMPISWQIPDAPKAFGAARTKGTPLADVAKGSRPHQAILEVARSLWPFLEQDSRKPRKGLFAALF